ncbi:protein kinase domain protein [Ichthyophthirius multifiliis]|uniref:Protein kinase domain protein n=1 Tax=Ichthyophthirius multifiliis TaxID=5932 RepID=G0QTX9_ICHMU|nr:protein kinase domain protein [Ichthyophthirius multifiliis]EGR31338.1 protein kinase domain protein [Ichthyophthirius multifiliis]|eukprot:XP_004034824.1 protein kinase domain protein [Ichthyophthirius multifiliis]
MIKEVSKQIYIKIYKKNKKDPKYKSLWDNVEDEIQIMKQLNNNNVVKLHQIIDNDQKSKLYLVIDYCEHGELLKWNEQKLVFTHQNPFNNENVQYIKKVMLGACKGLDYCNKILYLQIIKQKKYIVKILYIEIQNPRTYQQMEILNLKFVISVLQNNFKMISKSLRVLKVLFILCPLKVFQNLTQRVDMMEKKLMFGLQVFVFIVWYI